MEMMWMKCHLKLELQFLLGIKVDKTRYTLNIKTHFPHIPFSSLVPGNWYIPDMELPWNSSLTGNRMRDPTVETHNLLPP